MTALFESYNARFIEPKTVGETFVLRDREFSLLCEQNNSLLVGPRGSGKTTLLKMLKVGAQIGWKYPKQAKVLRRFSFAAIYVGADRQFDLVVKAIHLNDKYSNILDLLSKCLLATRIKFACLDTCREILDQKLQNLEFLSHQHVKYSLEMEVNCCKALAKTWDLGEPALSFLEIRSLLQLQLAEINRFIDRLKFDEEPPTAGSLIDHSPYLTHTPVHACLTFVDAFNTAFKVDDKIWALCIDELEIMPASLQEYLFSCLRSIDQRILLKLATSPFSSLSWDRSSVARPMPGHDYTPINLSFGRKQDAKRFTARLFDALLLSEGIQYRGRRSSSLGEAVLGPSPIKEAGGDALQREPYKAPNGEHYKRFALLREKDPSFRAFLDQRHIHLEGLQKASESQRAGQARKYIWPVAIRLEYGPTNIFRRPDKSIASRPASRKSVPDVYLGYDSLLTICEGNPRTTIGLLRPLARIFTGTSKPVAHEKQSELLTKTIAKYFSLLSSIQVGDLTQRYGSLIDVLDDIGAFLSKEVNGADFKPEPALSIKIDAATKPPIIEAIGNAMNQGAFVMLSDELGTFDFGSILESRIRLSYLLCPRYHIPLTYGQPINLSTITQVEKEKRRSTLSIRDLFEDAGMDDE